MADFAFYDAGCSGPSGVRRAVVPPRRLLRRLLRPIFQRLEAMLGEQQAAIDAAARRQAELEAQVEQLTGQLLGLAARIDTASAFRYDTLAASRRLAALEDHVESLRVANA